MIQPRRCLIALLLVCLAHSAVAADESWQGAPVKDYIEWLNTRGLRVIYSSDLVSERLTVIEEPVETDLVAALSAVLLPHNLVLDDGPAGSLLVVRGAAPPAPAAPVAAFEPPAPEPVLSEIIVTSSLHRLEYQQPGSHTYLDRDMTTRMPDLGEDAVRITHRLPGATSGGVSTQSHIRGGEANEVLFMLDGVRLYEPYHMKDFQNVATIINASAIDSIDFYSGGYPVRYGDRMSGVMNLSLREPGARTETELAFSLFNASVLSLGSFGGGSKGDWMVSARRGNLDLVLDLVDPEAGNPQYQDTLMHVGWDFGPRARVSANVLASHDKIAISDAGVGEVANAKYDNLVTWVRIDSDWHDGLRSQTLISGSFIRNSRQGTIDSPGIVSGSVDDARNFEALVFRQDWQYEMSKRWLLNVGVDYKELDAEYRYESMKVTAAPFDRILDNEPIVARSFDLSPDGSQTAAYSELRWQATEKLVLDLGLRWDRQTYTTADDDTQTSPRFSFLYRAGSNTEFRLGWGKFYQAQEINELQLNDGISEFFPAQRAEHVVASLSHTFPHGIDVQLAVYDKEFRSLRPRFENLFDPLVLIPELQIDRVRINARSAEARGAELVLSGGDTEDGLMWWASYAWTEVHDSVAEGNVKRSWDQTHTVKGGLNWRWGQWNLSAAGTVHTGWPKTGLIVDTVTNPDGSLELVASTTERNSQRYSNFHTVDARVSRDFQLPRGELTTFLEITNLYNRENPCCTEYSVREDTAGNPMVVSKQSHWLPIIPSIGVVWRF